MRPGERLLLTILSVLLIISTAGLLHSLSLTLMTQVPTRGGNLNEGIVGTPRFINPLLANSDADRNLTTLVYSGLMRAMPDGSLISDLAENYTISDNGTEYVFTIREGAVFHDKTPVTSADVAFTIAQAQNPDIKSPKRANWDGVQIEIMDEQTIKFMLEQPYAPFLENATIGILPQHLWSDIPADAFPFHQLNTKPIGSGPYYVKRVRADTTGTPTEYILRSFDRFTLGQPNITTINLKLYGYEDSQIYAYESGAVDAIAGITASKAELIKGKGSLTTTTLPRVFAVFFNQSQAPIFLSSGVRNALDTALDKEAIINAALSGYATALDGPIPPMVLQNDINSVLTTNNASSTAKIEKAQSILEKNGWAINEETGFYEKKGTELTFAISTADTPELVATANAVADTWRLMGANVTVKVFASGSINMSVIRPRNYDALLFGEVVGRTLDLFAFWHSTQRNDPGLNLALYTNSKADTLLTEARAETDRRAREEKYTSFAEIVQDDHPAVFLYAPDFLYYLPAKLKGVELGALTSASDRFLNVHQWHVETKNVWYTFSK